MIYAAGYRPLFELFREAKYIIRSRITKRQVELGKERGRVEGVDIDYNISSAAKFLLLDLCILCAGDGRTLCVVRRDGSLAIVSSRILIPPVEGGWGAATAFKEAATAANFSTDYARPEQVFGLQTLKASHWLDPMISNNLFSPRPSRPISWAVREASTTAPIVNWETGCISTDGLETLAKAVHAVKDAASQLRGIDVHLGLPFIDRSRFAGAERELHDLLSMFRHLDGCPIVFPNEWVDRLAQELNGKQEAVPAFDRDFPSPKEAILALKRDEPTLTRDEIRERLFPKMSRRGFDSHWRQAAEADPGISKAGRRRAKS